MASEVQAAFPGIPWKGIISTRHRLVHGYDSVSLDVVAAILERELPDLIPKLETILRQFPGD